MNRKGQIPPQLIAIIVGIVVLSILAPVFSELFNSIGCQREKGDIQNLQSQLAQCNNQLASNQAQAQDAINNLDECKKQLLDCQNNLQNCNTNYDNLKDECDKKEQPVTNFYFIKVFDNKLILFESLILYHIHLFAFFLTFGITFTIKLFEIDVEVKVLNKKNQKKLVRVIRNYLAEHPYQPLVIVIILIILTNIPLWIGLV